MKNTLKKIYTADLIFTFSNAPIDDGGLLIENEIILEVDKLNNLKKKYPNTQIIKFPKKIMLPGFVNLHAHLELTNITPEILGFSKNAKNVNFLTWLDNIITLKQTNKLLSSKNQIKNIKKGIKKSLDSGVTSLVNTTNPIIFDNISDIYKNDPTIQPLKIWWCNEIIDLKNKINQNQKHIESNIIKIISKKIKQNFHGGIGISPHSPYTASIQSYKSTSYLKHKSVNSKNIDNFIFTTHLAESIHELKAITGQSLELIKLLQKKGLSEIKNIYPDHNRESIKYNGLQNFRRILGIMDNCIIAHANHLSDYELYLLSQRNNIIVHCPKTHEFFGREKFPIKQIIKENIDLAIGTDSHASGSNLNLLEETKKFWQKNSSLLPIEKIFHMITKIPAKHIPDNKITGTLEPKSIADFLIFNHDKNKNNSENLIEILNSNKPEKIYTNAKEVSSLK